jgi:hypothetical protein
MSKPIFLIQCAPTLTPEKVHHLQKRIQDQIPDWHVLIALTLSPGAAVKFEAFTVKDADEIEIEKLKEILLKELSTL